MPKDFQLHIEGYLPNGGGTVNIGPLDLSVDQPGFSDNWRQGRLRVTIPAMPGFTNNANTITLTLQDSQDYGASYQSGGSGTAALEPLIQAQLPGVAANGTALTVIDLPLPPGLRGPIQLSMVVPAGVNVNDATGNPVLVTADWLNE